MKKRVMTLILALSLLVAMTGCGGAGAADMEAADSTGSYYNQSYDSGFAEPEAPNSGYDYAEEDVVLEDSLPDNAPEAGLGQNESYNAADVKLIKTAEMNVEALDFDAAIVGIERTVVSMGGYFERSEIYTGGYYDNWRSANFTVRIPAEQYDAFLNAFGDENVCRISRIVRSTQDVGLTYFDLENRLRTQQIKLERLQELLAEATWMEDIITIENEITDVEYYIESYSSELNRYDSLIGYSTVYIYVEEVTYYQQDTGETLTLGQRISAGFRNGMENLKDGFEDFLVSCAENFVGTIVVIIILAGVVVVIVKVNKKRRQRRLKPPVEAKMNSVSPQEEKRDTSEK